MMRTHEIKVITKIAEHTLKNRPQAPEIIEWVKKHTCRFDELILSFDQSVIGFNDLSEEDIPRDLINARNLKKALGSKCLPTINKMSESDNPLDLFGTLKHVNQMMIRGETTQEEPWLLFQTIQIDKESLTVAAIIHTYEEYCLARANLPQKVSRGMVEFAIEEVSSLDPNNPIWQTVSDKDKLNWIDGADEFSKDFRTRNQLS